MTSISDLSCDNSNAWIHHLFKPTAVIVFSQLNFALKEHPNFLRLVLTHNLFVSFKCKLPHNLTHSFALALRYRWVA
jgi:hypothetical protein